MDPMIDQEFADKIPPLTKEEFEQLEANILADGVVINPLIVWNGVIVDGHNRYRILQMHPEIPYQIHEKEFTDRYEVIAWICKNQLGRKNPASFLLSGKGCLYLLQEPLRNRRKALILIPYQIHLHFQMRV